MPQRVPAQVVDREAHQARLVRNLLALRMLLCMDQMRTGQGADRIAEIDEALGELGHDMSSTAASAADGLRRSFLLPRLVRRKRAARGSGAAA